MKRILFSVLTLIGLSAQAQIKMPAASPTQTLSQDFGMGKVDITYSRPALKGRAAFGNGSVLAPTGVVWRTGANGATKLTFSHPVTIGGKLLAAGSYALFTLPGETACPGTPRQASPGRRSAWRRRYSPRCRAL